MENMYYVKNISCVSYLKAKGFKVAFKEVKDGTVLFYFVESEALLKAKEEFYKDEFIQKLNKEFQETRKELWELKIAAEKVINGNDHTRSTQ